MLLMPFLKTKKIMIYKIFKLLTNPWKMISVIADYLGCILPDKLFLSIKYKAYYGAWPNLVKPRTFIEKINWLKIYGVKPEFTIMVDKVLSKDYVASRIGRKYIIPTLGVWNKVEDIDWGSLPSQFVIKTSHDSGGVVICKDKNSFDVDKAQKVLKSSMRRNFYKLFRERPYKNVPKKIIAEKYLQNKESKDLSDYKFYCFNGEPMYCQVIRDRSTHETIDFYDSNWNHMPFVGLNPGIENGDTAVGRPNCLNELLDKCRVLSEGCPFIRVDFYIVNNQPYFGELTFYPGGGFGYFSSEEWNVKLGELIKL